MIGNIPSIKMNSGHMLPQLGLGVYKAIEPGEVEYAIDCAFEAGYRMIDTASVYKNEEGVGRALRSSRLKRDEFFVTTKIWNNAQRVGDIEGSFKRSLDRLQLDYVDLYLVHWPVPGCYPETWKALEKIYHSGRAKSIGVSNFTAYQLEELRVISDIVPAVNQIEFHPYWDQSELAAYCNQHGIAVQAYAPLARGAYLKDPVILKIAEAHNRSAAQVGLRWLIQKGVSVIPKSSKEKHIFSNCEIFAFSLTKEEMEQIDGLNKNYRAACIPEDIREYYV